MKCCHKVQVVATQTKTTTTKIGHTQKLVMFCSKLRGILMIKHAKLVLPSKSLSLPLSLSQSLWSHEWKTSKKSWNNAEKKFFFLEKNQEKNTGHKMSPALCLTRCLLLTNLLFKWTSTAQHKKKKKNWWSTSVFLCVSCKYSFRICECECKCVYTIGFRVHKWNQLTQNFPSHVNCRNCRCKAKKKNVNATKEKQIYSREKKLFDWLAIKPVRTESHKLAHEMGRLFTAFFVNFFIWYCYNWVYLCRYLVRANKTLICRVCWLSSTRDDRVDFLSHAFFKKTCNDGDKDGKEEARGKINSIQWPNHLNQHHLSDDDDDDVDEVNVCCVVW